MRQRATEANAREHAEKHPTTPAGFYAGTKRNRLYTRINYIHLVWQEATRHGLPPPSATTPARYSMAALLPIFRLPMQALGPALRAAGWRRHNVRGGVRTWIPPDLQTMANVNEHVRKQLAADRLARAIAEQAKALADPFYAVRIAKRQADAVLRAAHARAAIRKT